MSDVDAAVGGNFTKRELRIAQEVKFALAGLPWVLCADCTRILVDDALTGAVRLHRCELSASCGDNDPRCQRCASDHYDDVHRAREFNRPSWQRVP